MTDPITRYDQMPIPPVAAQTTWFDAGAVRIGVEFYTSANPDFFRGTRCEAAAARAVAEES